MDNKLIGAVLSILNTRYFTKIYNYWTSKDQKNKRDLLLSLAYSTFLISLPFNVVDRASYITYSRYSDDILWKYYEKGVLEVLTNEPVWLLLNAGMNYLFSPYYTILTIIFISSFFLCYLMLKNVQENGEYVWVVLILFLPLIIKNYIIHLRQGVAITIFVCGYFSPVRRSRLILFMMAGLTHSSFLILFTLYVIYELQKKIRLEYYLAAFFLTVVAVLVAFSLEYGALSVGARQGLRYVNKEVSVGTGLGVIFWIIVIIFINIDRVGVYENKDIRLFYTSSVALYITSYFFLPFAGRIIESVAVIILFVCLSLSRKLINKYKVVVMAYFVYGWFLSGDGTFDRFLSKGISSTIDIDLIK